MKTSSSAFSFGSSKRGYLDKFKEVPAPDHYFRSRTRRNTLYDGSSSQKPCIAVFGKEKREKLYI